MKYPSCRVYCPASRIEKSDTPSLSLIEREEISRGLVEGSSFRQLGRDLGRAVSTISREVAGNGGRRAYRATRADERASDRALRPKPCREELAAPGGNCDTGCRFRRGHAASGQRRRDDENLRVRLVPFSEEHGAVISQLFNKWPHATH